MRAIGIVRKMDELGRIVIPIELRRSFDITEGDPIEIYTGKQNEIILMKYVPKMACGMCGTVNETCNIGGNYICQNCIKNIKDYDI